VNRKIIIEMRDDDITDLVAAWLVRRVIEQGKISTEKGQPVYCHVTAFEVNGIDGKVFVSRTPYTRDGLVKFVVECQNRSVKGERE
jgi:hypothetical protein